MRLLSLLLSAGILFSCSKEGKKMANLSVKMTNNKTALTEEGLSLDSESYTTPDYMKLKIIAVELVKDDGRYVAVWVNPNCTAEKSKIDLGEKSSSGQKEMAEFYSAENCSLSTISTYVDIAKSSEEVNATLNSQSWPVPPGTYTSVSIRMCKLGDTDADKVGSLVYKGSNMAEEKSTANASCGVTGAPVSAITVAEGVTAKIDLQYDASKLLQINTMTGDGADTSKIPADSKNAGCYYPASGTVFYCHRFGASTFVPSLVTQ